MRLQYTIFFIAFAILFSNCVRVPGNSEPGNENPELNPWVSVDNLISEQLILNLKATAFSLFVISEGEYFILDDKKQIASNHVFLDNPKNHGIPAFSDNVFVRLGSDGVNRKVVEFHATKAPDRSVNIKEEELAESPNETIRVNSTISGEIGAFNSAGNRFLLSTISSPKVEQKFILFKVETDASTYSVQNVSIADDIPTGGYIVIDDIPTDDNSINTIKHFGDYFYVGASTGAYRIDKDGRVSKISDDWTLDFFRGGSNLYSTSLSGSMHVSEDNGRTWDRSNLQSDLKFVKIRGPKLVSQNQIGQIFHTPDDINYIFDVEPMKINPTLEGNEGLYRAFEFFNQEYYFSVGKELYFADDIVAE